MSGGGRWRLKALAGAAAAAALLAAPAAAETIAIAGGKVHTLGPQGTLEAGTVVVRDGRIVAVVEGAAAPAGARVIDARGKVVTPGLIDSFNQLGIVEVSAVEGTRDGRVEDDEITAALAVAAAVNPASELIAVNRVEGITHALIAPQPGESLIAGQAAVIHLGMGPDLVVRAPAAMIATLGERGSRLAGGSRSAALLRLREALEDARDYARNRAAWERGERRPYALSRLDLEALAPVVEGQLPLVLAVERASDIRMALALKRDEPGLSLILAGAAEGWRVAEEIAAARVPVFVNPMVDLPDSFEALGATLENAARLHAAGVELAFMSGETHNSRNLKQAAGNAASYGLPPEAALAAMTSVPARIWGLADRLGTLEPGKEAHLVVWDGDPLEVTTFADHVLIGGVEVPRETRQTRLRERYRKLDGPLPPAYSNP